MHQDIETFVLEANRLGVDARLACGRIPLATHRQRLDVVQEALLYFDDELSGPARRALSAWHPGRKIPSGETVVFNSDLLDLPSVGSPPPRIPWGKLHCLCRLEPAHKGLQLMLWEGGNWNAMSHCLGSVAEALECAEDATWWFDDEGDFIRWESSASRQLPGLLSLNLVTTAGSITVGCAQWNYPADRISQEDRSDTYGQGMFGRGELVGFDL